MPDCYEPLIIDWNNYKIHFCKCSACDYINCANAHKNCDLSKEQQVILNENSVK